MVERRGDFDDAQHPVLAVMEKRGIGRIEAARMAELSQGYFDQVIYRWRRPSLDVMVRLRDLFGVAIDDLAAVPLRDPPRRPRGRARR